jgi:ubiquinol-cytochrome c reductase cytochrome b subunit
MEDRTGLGETIRGCLEARITGGACWCRVWPATIGFALCVQLLTGFFMWMYYSPGAQTAWESVYFLQYEVAGGWLLRAMHHWSGQVLLVLVGLYLIQMVLTGGYRAPRELVFWTVLLMALVTLGSLLTGDLLAWDQNSFSSAQTRVNFLELLPWVGGGLWRLAAGGPQFGHLTLTRFLVLHICCLSGSLLLLLVLHVVLGRRADAAQTAAAEGSVPWWPQQALRNAVAMVVVLAVVLLLSLRHGISGDGRGVELGSPADTSSAFAAARPEWAFRGLYEFAHLFPGDAQIVGLSLKILPIFVIPGLLVCIFLAMPWIARRPAGHWLNVGFTSVVLVGVVVLSLVSVRKDSRDEEYQAAVSTEDEHAQRALQLARAKEGIPVTGAITLLREDPKTQGPILFKTHCASCHNYLDAQQQGIKAEKPSAPNLYGFATRQWIAGLLDPRTLTGPDYFGNTKLRRGDMVDFVETLYEDLEAAELKELKEELSMVVAALSAEAKLKSQRELDEQDATRIAKGKALFAEIGCTDCHKFHDQGRLGVAPDHTGYGSREWTMAIIANAADRRFYRNDNDRMPIYAESPNDPAKNILQQRELGLLTDWLRGEWFEE